MTTAFQLPEGDLPEGMTLADAADVAAGIARFGVINSAHPMMHAAAHRANVTFMLARAMRNGMPTRDSAQEAVADSQCACDADLVETVLMLAQLLYANGSTAATLAMGIVPVMQATIDG